MHISKKYNFFVEDLLLSIYCFFAIFLPDISRFSTTNMMWAVNIILSVFCCLKRGKIAFNIKTINLVWGFVPFFIYFFCMQFVHMNKGINDYPYRLLLLQTSKAFLYNILTIFTVLSLCKLLNMDMRRLAKILICCTMCQMFFVMTSFLIPSVKTRLLNTILRNSKSDLIKKAIRQNAFFRCYGFADNLFDAFGYVMAVLTIITFIYGIDRKQKKIVYLGFFTLIAPLLDARTGVVLSAAALLVTLFFYFDFRKVIFYMFYAALAFIGLRIIYAFLPSQTQTFLINGIESTMRLMENGETTGVYSVILEKNLILPQHIFIGDGGAPELLARKGIDSGYIQCLWRYGLIGSALLFWGYINMYRVTYKATDKKAVKCLSICVIVIFFLYLFKLYSIGNYGANILIFGIPAAIINISTSEKQEEQTSSDNAVNSSVVSRTIAGGNI